MRNRGINLLRSSEELNLPTNLQIILIFQKIKAFPEDSTFDFIFIPSSSTNKSTVIWKFVFLSPLYRRKNFQGTKILPDVSPAIQRILWFMDWCVCYSMARFSLLLFFFEANTFPFHSQGHNLYQDVVIYRHLLERKIYRYFSIIDQSPAKVITNISRKIISFSSSCFTIFLHLLLWVESIW